VPRSSFYAARQAEPNSAEPRPPARRGPKPAIPDQTLLAAIRRDLERSPWTGEGHRKIWACLRLRDRIRVSRKRLLRLMREHALLSPHRPRCRREGAHQRQIITAAPNRTARSGSSASPNTGTPSFSAKQVSFGWPTDAGCDSVFGLIRGGRTWLANLR
jgi:hypothetical protein